MNNHQQFQNFSDENIYRRFSGGLYRTMSRGSGGWIADFLSGIFYFFINMGAFTVRVFLRRKMGVRSFGLISVLLSYIWLRLFLINSYVFENSCEMFFGFEDGTTCNWGNYAEYYLSPTIDLFDFIPGGYINAIEGNLSSYLSFFNTIEAFGLGLHLLSISVLFLGVLHFFTAIVRDIRKVKWHSFHRGTSLFFNWLNGRSVFGLFTINEHLIWAVVEPLFVLFIAYTLAIFSQDWALILCLKIAAWCLAIQEFQVWNRNKNMVRNMIDQEIDSSILLEEREKFKAINGKSDKTIIGLEVTKATL